MTKPIVFSGIKPSGIVTLGNYLGAMKHWVANQGEKTNYYCVVDLHSLTVPQDPQELLEQTRSLFAWLIAVGLDPDQTTLFVQSHVPAHAEACWLLNTVTPMGWLSRMTQYKDYAAKNESVGTGIFDYPVLMAGDIILYDATEVPVGDDQKQHVELTRDIVATFNNRYGEAFFVTPEPVIPTVAARVMGLDDPSNKMSKSHAHIRGHAVGLGDDPKEILRSFKKAKTDGFNEIAFSDDPERAGVNNLLGIYKAITGKTNGEVEADFASARGYGDLKVGVAEVVIDALRPLQEEYGKLMSDSAELDSLMKKGADAASDVAQAKVDQMKEIMGLIVPKSRKSRITRGEMIA